MTQNPTMKQVGGRAVGAEGGGVVRIIMAVAPTRAGVSEGDAGAVCTLELGVRKARGGGGREEGEEEHSGVRQEREHPEEGVRGFSVLPSYLYSISPQMSGLVHAIACVPPLLETVVQLSQTEVTTGPGATDPED